MIDIVTHAIAFALIFMKHMVPVLESLLIVSNVTILLIMAQADQEYDKRTIDIDRNAIFGLKIIFGVSLLYLRFETVRIQITVLRQPSS